VRTGSRTRRRLTVFALVSATLCAALAGCAALSPKRKAADNHAQVAQTVIERHYGPWPLKYAVRAVVGNTPTSTITVRRMSGTTWSGSLVLAVTVHDSSEFGTDYTRCYAYRFDHFDRDGGDSVDGMSDCPSGPPLHLPHVPAEPFNEAGVQVLRQALDALPTPRTSARVQSVTARMFPVPASVTAGRNGGTISVEVLLDLDCVKAQVPVAGAGHAKADLIITGGPDCGS
jgi:hypothetical protein